MQLSDTIRPSPSNQLRAFVESRSGQRILQCYQCGKCSAGCPSAYLMDLTPRQIMRALQLGLKDEALASSTIWLCLFCQTCTARCPREIDIAKVIETLRLLAIQEGIRPAQREVKLFHRLFLSLIRRWGRIYELGLGGLYNLLSRHPLANLRLAPALLRRGKLSLLPVRSRGTKEARQIFAKVAALEAKGKGTG